MVIDFHAHIFPDPMGLAAQTSRLRRPMRQMMKPYSDVLHRLQAFTRIAPPNQRGILDGIETLAGLPTLLATATAQDLQESMHENKVDRTVIVAQPPMSSNTLILETCQQNSNLIPAVCMPFKQEPDPDRLKKYAEMGAKIVRIYGDSPEDGPDGSHSAALLQIAAQCDLIVSIAQAKPYERWLREHPQVRFVISHMNTHEPTTAIDLAEELENVWLTTSWQPSETIGEAVRRIGSDRILFSSDWPVFGENQRIAIEQIHEARAIGMIDDQDVDQILGGNAARLLSLARGANG